jgi:NTP pyrophosphatase (non-canonical NTP hydrolase)
VARTSPSRAKRLVAAVDYNEAHPEDAGGSFGSDAAFDDVYRYVEDHRVDSVVPPVRESTEAEVVRWIRTNFGPPTPWGTVGGLTEEVGELARCMVKMEQGIRGTREEWVAEARKETGDVLIKLMDVADYFGFSVLEAFAERWETIRRRDWTTDKVGHGIPKEDEA